MHRIPRCFLAVGLFAGITFGSLSVQAQYTADFQTNLISGSGVVSNWTGHYLVGNNHSRDALIIQLGAILSDAEGRLGETAGSSSNGVWIASGARWENNVLLVGNQGSSNTLVVAGGVVSASNLVVGANSATCDNVVRLNSGGVFVSTPNGDGMLEVRHGRIIMNGGVLQADTLVMTNGCGLFIRNGGLVNIDTFILAPSLDADGDGMPNGWETQYGLDPLNDADAAQDADGDGFSNLQEYLAGTDPTNHASYPHVTSIVQTGSDVLVTWLIGAGRTNALQALAGGFATNSFNNIFVAMNTNATGVVTNYLDSGAVTNSAARFYRLRVEP